MTRLEQISAQVVARFGAAHKTLGTAESLTGGMIASSVADVSGASAVLMGGVVSYDPRVKHEVLGVSQQVIDTVGVVSEPCARQMAEGARSMLKVDVAVSATGVAGPTGGYIVGYIPLVIIAGILVERYDNRIVQLLGMILGTAVLYALGTAWFCVQSGTPLGEAMGMCVIPFIPGDLIKMVIALVLGPVIRDRLKKAGLLGK